MITQTVQLVNRRKCSLNVKLSFETNVVLLSGLREGQVPSRHATYAWTPWQTTKWLASLAAATLCARNASSNLSGNIPCLLSLHATFSDESLLLATLTSASIRCLVCTPEGCACLRRTSLKDKTYPIICPEIGCDCSLDPEVDIKPVFTTKKEAKEYGELLDVAAVSCIPEKDRFYCPNPACSALYDFTDHK